MATTTNYSWTTPDDTALVKDGAAAIRSLGTAVDTTVFNNATAVLSGTQTLTNKTLTAPVITDAVIRGFEEDVNIVAAAATGTINFDVSTASVWYYTTNATANHTLNFRYSSGVSLDTALAIGDAITLVWLNTNGATPYYPNVINIDGSAVTPKVPSAITGGNASSIDAYSFTIIKTASATFTVLETQTKFAQGETMPLIGTIANSSARGFGGLRTFGSGIVATGGTVVTSGGYKYHTFTANGTFTVTNGGAGLEMLVIGGGGSGGGYSKGAGGGAGGLCYHPNKTVTATNYSIVIGGGGNGANGGNTTALSVQGNGGGYGGSENYGTSGTAGGSGGAATRLGSAGSANQTNNGGATGYGNAGAVGVEGVVFGSVTMFGGSGGGGAGTAGFVATGGVGGIGGDGLNTWSSWATATSTGASGYFAGGGGGQLYTTLASGTVPGGAGGAGGGGLGGDWQMPAGVYGTGANGQTNTGSGGGGGNTSVVASGGLGGSGIVILRYIP